MDLGGVVNRHFQQTKNDMYQNSGYCDSRNNKQILILDIWSGDMTDATTAFDGSTPAKGELHEPLIIDTLSDVYLDNFTTLEALDNSSAASRSFILSIDQFQIKSNSNRSEYYNNIVIPNEESTGVAGRHKIHKGRKMNYVCSLNPQKITKLSGKLTNFAGAKAIVDSSANSGFICEFIIVARN